MNEWIIDWQRAAFPSEQLPIKSYSERPTTEAMEVF